MSREIPPATRATQLRVSDPAVSAWVSANAGTGKTTVLARRVIRLLLAGTAPSRILCLTYTKAAAAHMANKVLGTLRKWVQLPDAELDLEIAATGPGPLSPERRAFARRLFAAALETPGGLKVQTIHAFCDRLLHQFPFEARVPAGFAVLDEVQAADLLQRARTAVLVKAAAEPDSALARSLARVVSIASDRMIDEALAEAVAARREVLRAVHQAERPLASSLGLRPGESVAAIETQVLQDGLLPRAAGIIERLRAGSKIDRELASRLQAAIDAPTADRCAAYLEAFLTADGDLREQKLSARLRSNDPDLAEIVDREYARIAVLLDKHRAASALERTEALFALADAVVRQYEDLKRARGLLDYDDLISKTAAMLSEYGSSWVLYKLDRGIDHVLIDEAQDTSPEQWQLIAKLTEEFFAGRGARDTTRTVFAVGDDKQSIFSFQGADPAGFHRMRLQFERRAAAAALAFEPARLDLSFRSARGVLGAIDRVFGKPPAYHGLSSGEAIPTAHTAIRDQAPSLVEIWPTVKPAEDDDDALPWDAPLDARSLDSPPVRLAQAVARAVKFWTAGGLAVGDERRPARAGDVIVLVRQRGVLFEALLQALKQAGLPVAGADRLKLTEHIAVMDLIALGDAVLLEADDLALACALKSPLFGFSEEQLYELAHGRSGTLSRALNERADTDLVFRDALTRLTRWREEASTLRPFDFYSRVLGRDGARARFLGRLGEEAADAIDEFLAHALAYERTETPSLAGFLAFLRRAGTEVKRDLEVESDAVRVMTVHGAKGLEAPIIVLADTVSMPDGRTDPKIVRVGDAASESRSYVWATAQKLDSERLRAARLAAREAREAEYRRLLYVALTRAADALIICGHETRNNARLADGCWYQLVHGALRGDGDRSELVETEVPYCSGKVWRWRPEPMQADAPAKERAAPAIDIPDWLTAPVPEASAPVRRISPSKIPNGDRQFVRAGRATGFDPLQRGALLHRLLQSLPALSRSNRREAAARFLSRAAGEMPATLQSTLLDEALAILDHPELADLFGPGSRGEVEFAARLPELPDREISGRIDRLAIARDAILLADFKSDSAPAETIEEVPEQYVRQLALYRAAMQRVFEDRTIRAFLVWTGGPIVQEIPPSRLDATVERLTSA